MLVRKKSLTYIVFVVDEEIIQDRGYSNEGEEDDGEDGMGRRKEKKEMRRELPHSPIM